MSSSRSFSSMDMGQGDAGPDRFPQVKTE